MTPAKASFLPSLNEIGPGAPGSPAANPGSAEPGEFTRIVGSPISPMPEDQVVLGRRPGRTCRLWRRLTHSGERESSEPAGIRPRTCA